MWARAKSTSSAARSTRPSPSSSSPAELNPSPQTLTLVGAALRQNGLHDASVPMFEEAAKLEPSAKAYTYWGMALRDAGNHQKARAVFAKAIEADPKLGNGYNQLGLSYLDEKQWDKAAEEFATAIKLAPQWSNYQYNLGLAQRGAGKLDEAIASFAKTLAIYPSHAWSYAQWGATLAEREHRDNGTVSEATAKLIEEKFNRAFELKPALREAYGATGGTEQAMDAHRRDRSQGGINSEIKSINRPSGGGSSDRPVCYPPGADRYTSPPVDGRQREGGDDARLLWALWLCGKWLSHAALSCVPV